MPRNRRRCFGQYVKLHPVRARFVHVPLVRTRPADVRLPADLQTLQVHVAITEHLLQIERTVFARPPQILPARKNSPQGWRIPLNRRRSLTEAERRPYRIDAIIRHQECHAYASCQVAVKVYPRCMTKLPKAAAGVLLISVAVLFRKRCNAMSIRITCYPVPAAPRIEDRRADSCPQIATRSGWATQPDLLLLRKRRSTVSMDSGVMAHAARRRAIARIASHRP